jgi:hypothetical protein
MLLESFFVEREAFLEEALENLEILIGEQARRVWEADRNQERSIFEMYSLAKHSFEPFKDWNQQQLAFFESLLISEWETRRADLSYEELEIILKFSKKDDLKQLIWEEIIARKNQNRYLVV